MRPAGRAAALALLLGAAALPGCESAPPTLDDEQYVEVMARLSWAEALIDGVKKDSLRAAILAEQGVTAAQVMAYSERFGGDVGRMDRLWEAIRVRVDSLNATMPAPDVGDGRLRVDSLPGQPSAP